MNLSKLQQTVWGNKALKGYNLTDMPLEFCLLQEKSAAAFTAWRKGKKSLGEELADVVLYVSSIAEMAGLELQREVEAKVNKNSARSD